LAVGRETIAVTEYGTEFSAAVAHANFFGTQFHPERSAATGAAILRNFLALH
jgi:glutamine amidotransferase